MSVLNGDPDHRYPGNLNYSFAYVEGESLLMVSSSSLPSSQSLTLVHSHSRISRSPLAQRALLLL
jgi:hypothetical protein